MAEVLVGPGEVEAALPWDGPETSAILAGERTSGPVAAALRRAGVVLAWTRSAAVTEALRRHAPRVVSHDPSPPEGGPHASSWLARPLAELGMASPPAPPPLAFTEAELRQAEVLLADLPPAFVAVHPGSGSPAKNWPADRFAQAARSLSDGAPWLLALGPAEEGITPPAGARAARCRDLRELAAVLARSGVFLGNDSGASHLAAAAGAPTLALFGPTDPALWAPVGRAVRVLRPSTGVVADLGLDEVVEAAAALRSAASGPPSG